MHFIKRFLSLLIFLICLTYVAAAQTENDFNVGVIIPLTGDLADYGTSMQRGFELAKTETPQKFLNINFIFEDSKYDAKTAVSALNKLRNTNKVDLYYAWGVSPAEAIIPITESNKLPLLVETTLKESVANKKYVIRAARTGERIAQALTEELSKRGIKKISLIFADIPFYLDIIKHLNILLPKRNIEITQIKNILPSQDDMRPFMLGLMKHSEQAIGVFLLPAQIVSFYRRAAELQLAISTFGADIIGSESIIKDCPDNVNGVFFTEVGVTSDFRTLYHEKFGYDGHIGHAAQAFDVANLIGDLFGSSEHELSPEDIIKNISQIAPRKGATGEYKFSNTPDGGKELKMPVAIKTVKDKRIETVIEDTKF